MLIPDIVNAFKHYLRYYLRKVHIWNIVPFWFRNLKNIDEITGVRSNLEIRILICKIKTIPCVDITLAKRIAYSIFLGSRNIKYWLKNYWERND